MSNDDNEADRTGDDEPARTGGRTDPVVEAEDDDPPPLGSEDLIESEAASTRGTEIRRRLELLAPSVMGRRLGAGIAAAALVLGLVAGFLVGRDYGSESTASLGLKAVSLPEGGFIPFFPEDPLLEEGVIVLTVGTAFLNADDLVGAGETPVRAGTQGFDFDSGLNGLCGNVPRPELPPVPPPVINPIASVSFALDGATLTEHIGPDLGVLAASTLRGTVELARTCANSVGLTVATEGVSVGIGDEYAAFSLSRLNPGSGLVENSIVVLVRVGNRLVEISLTPDGALDVPDGPARALRIAEVAVTRMLAG